MKCAMLIVVAATFFAAVISPTCLYADYVQEWRSPDNSELLLRWRTGFFQDEILDLNGDGVPEIPIRIGGGILPTYQFYDSEHPDTPIWSFIPSMYPAEDSDWSFYGFADIDADGAKEALFSFWYVYSDSSGTISVSTETGDVEWELPKEGDYGECDKMITDIDRDGNDELLIQYGEGLNYHLEVWGSDVWTKAPNPSLVSTPSSYQLSQNYPNPFNPSTKVEYSVQKEDLVRIRIYNTLGQLVRTLVDEVKLIGEYAVTWDGKNDNGRLVASGTYFYQLQVGEFLSNKKMVLLK